MNKKILLFSRDPGGANAVIPLFDPLKEKGYHVELFGKDFALKKYREFNLIGKDIMDYITSVSASDLVPLLKEIKPDIIVTGTSAGDFTEKYLWKAAEELKIPSFAILDQWINYRVRFSGQYLPTKILVMDDYAKEEIIKEGFDSARILITGQPYFELLLNRITAGFDNSSKIKKELRINKSCFLITYASEPIMKTYKSTNYWGYTEKTIFKEILSTLREISLTLNRKFAVIIRTHPKEDVEYWIDVINSFKYENISLLIGNKINGWDLILASNLVCGMSSMFLTESVILKKPVISVQIGLKRKNPFILDRIGISKSITDRKKLSNALKSLIINNKYPICKFNIIKNPIQNVINNIEKYICQN